MGGMAASLVELSDTSSVDRAARELFGSNFDERPEVSHSFAAWEPEDGAPLATILINAHSPKSSLDFLALHIARARADAIVITGKILREEPKLTFDLQADPRWGDSLVAWRKERWGIADPPWLLILTRSGDIDFGHSAFHGWPRPLIFTSDRTASRKLAAATCPVIADDAPNIRRAVRHLRIARECRCISIEAGPSSACELYDSPMMVDELLLSVYSAPSLDPRARGESLDTLSETRGRFDRETWAAHDDDGQRWTFHRLRR